MWNEGGHINVKYHYRSQIWYLTYITFHYWGTGLHLSSQDLKDQFFAWLFQMHTHHILKATELEQSTNEVTKKNHPKPATKIITNKQKNPTCCKWEFETLKQITNQLLHGIYWPNSTVISVDNLHQLPICSWKIKDRNLNIFWKSWHCQAKYVHMPDSFLSSSRGCSLLRLFPAKYICLIYVINFCVNEGWRLEKAECIYLSRG